MANKENRPLKKGLFDLETLTVKFGNEKSKPEFVFTAQAIHVPSFEYQVYEREDAGGGWYGQKEWVTKTASYEYLIVKDGVCIGVFHHPYMTGSIKSELYPITDKTHIQIRKFFQSLNIPYQHYISNKEQFLKTDQQSVNQKQ